MVAIPDFILQNPTSLSAFLVSFLLLFNLRAKRWSIIDKFSFANSYLELQINELYVASSLVQPIRDIIM